MGIIGEVERERRVDLPSDDSIRGQKCKKSGENGQLVRTIIGKRLWYCATYVVGIPRRYHPSMLFR